MEKATSEQWIRLNRELWENFTKYNLHLPRAQRDLAVRVRGRVAFDLALEGKVPDLKFWCRADELHFLGQSPVVWFLKVHSLKSQRIIVQGFHRVHFTKDLLTPSKTAVSKCSVILIPLFFSPAVFLISLVPHSAHEGQRKFSWSPGYNPPPENLPSCTR